MIRTLLAAALGALLTLPVQAADSSTEAAPPTAQPGASSNPATAWTQMFSGFDASSWKDAAGHVAPGTTVTYNPVHPASWMMWVDPRSHSKAHMAFTNPAQYAQFMQPQFYMAMMDPNAWMAWMNPATYQVMMDPATWAYWMQPGAYMHAMNPAMYMQAMNPNAYAAYWNPATYMGWSNPAAYAVPASAGSGDQAAPVPNLFDPNAWMSLFGQAQTAQPAAQ